ncbi:MAG: tyrosine-protein phosphatase [Acidovorax sp.]|nr:tyrosine-protein phosphatase [Acidovorax sp.]
MLPASTPSRSVPLAGASNFRDLGGYAGAGGRRVKWRRIFRADHLAALTAEDRAHLAALGIARAVDFRGEHERAALGYTLPRVEQHVLTIEPTVVQRAQQLLQAGHALTAREAVGLMQDTYRGFVGENASRFAQLFALLLASDAPLVFHCTAGKDRTGFAAALVLLALGVPRDVVMQDYLLTNTLYRRPEGLAGPAPREVLEVLWRVQEDFLNAALDGVDRHPGGFDGYLAGVLDVHDAERRRLEALYLE